MSAARAKLLPCGSEVGAPIPLPEHDLFRIGRDDPSDLPLRDAAVSREHATIEFDGRRWFVTDLGSANGTFVNGRRIVRRRLRGGEALRFGSGVQYRFLTEGESAGFASILRTLVRHALVARDPAFKPRRILVGPAPKIIGRTAKVEVRLPFPEISDVHARLEDRGGSPWVIDQKSRNGTFVNGDPVRESKLKPGDEVAFARTPFDVVATAIPSTRGLVVTATACALLGFGAWGASWWGQRGSGSSLWTREMYEDHARRSLTEALDAADRRPPALEIAEARFDIAIRALMSADRLAPGEPSTEEIGAAFERYAGHLKQPLAGRTLGQVYVALLKERERKETVPEPLPPVTRSTDVVEVELARIVAEFGIDVAQHPVPPSLLAEVKRFVDHWTGGNREYTVRSIERGRPHLAMIRSELRRSHLPEVFCYLPFVESGYRTAVVSGAGAQGLWQFMPRTARNYGLRVEGDVDERTDPVLATRAACKYLEGLLATFGTDAFMCAIAAYNKGEYGMVSCLTQNVLKKNVSFLSRWKFWDLVEKGDGCLKQETIEYVPKFLSAAIVLRRPEVYGFTAASLPLPSLEETAATESAEGSS